jgi:hypothetical protein
MGGHFIIPDTAVRVHNCRDCDDVINIIDRGSFCDLSREDLAEVRTGMMAALHAYDKPGIVIGKKSTESPGRGGILVAISREFCEAVVAGRASGTLSLETRRSSCWIRRKCYVVWCRERFMGTTAHGVRYGDPSKDVYPKVILPYGLIGNEGLGILSERSDAILV